MKSAAFHLEPNNGLITVVIGNTPSTFTHTPDSVYFRYFWLTQLGPTATLAWTHLVTWLPDNDNATVTIDYEQFAHALGTSPGRLTKALQRLAGFHLAHTLLSDPAVLHVKRRAPTLSPGQLARLTERCPTLAAFHEQQRHVA